MAQFTNLQLYVSKRSPNTTGMSTIVLHDTGDVVMLAIGKKKLFVNAARTVLIILSPVFKAMLTGNFREAGATASEILLPDDDPDALLFLLRIAHLKFKDLPDTLLFQDLYQLSVTCDKYDVVGPVRPFWDRYGAPFLSHIEEAGYEEWLHIAWTFGVEDVYIKVMNKLIVETQIIGEHLSRAGRHLESILPLYAFEHIVETRSKVIEGLISLTNAQFDKLRSEKGQTSGDYHCRRYKLGRMTEHLIAKASFIPKASNASDFDKITIVELSRHLKGIVLGPCGNPAGGCARAECKEEQNKFIESIDKLVQSSDILPEEFITHFNSQASK